MTRAVHKTKRSQHDLWSKLRSDQSPQDLLSSGLQVEPTGNPLDRRKLNQQDLRETHFVGSVGFLSPFDKKSNGFLLLD